MILAFTLSFCENHHFWMNHKPPNHQYPFEHPKILDESCFCYSFWSLLFLQYSKVLTCNISELCGGLVGWVHSKECYFIFTHTFLTFFCSFSSKKMCFYHFHIFFWGSIKFPQQNIINQSETETVIWNYLWKCLLHCNSLVYFLLRKSCEYTPYLAWRFRRCFKGTLVQIWKHSYMFVFKQKQCPENVVFLIQRILELLAPEVCKFIKKQANL